MKNIIIILGILSVSIMYCCEKNIIEEEISVDNSKASFTDENGIIILHENSITYYNTEKNLIYSSLYERINNKKIDSEIHSFEIDHTQKTGILTYPSSNKIEFVQSNNFNSLGHLILEHSPTYVALIDGYAFISCHGDEGAIYIVDCIHQKIINRLGLDYAPGKILKFKANDYDITSKLFVLHDGGSKNDSLISIYSYNSLNGFYKNGDIQVGYNPIDIIENNSYLAVLCNGKKKYLNNAIVSQDTASIVVYEIEKKKISSTCQFESENSRPTSLFDFNYTGNYVEFICDSKLYTAGLTQLGNQTLLIQNNITSLLSDKYVLGLSVKNNAASSYLYRYNRMNYMLIDSIKIDAKAMKLINFPN